MKLSARIAAPVAAFVPAGLTATACAPSTSPDGGAKADARTGSLRVRLFQEVNNKPEEEAVRKALDAFGADHKAVEVDVDYIRSRPERRRSRPPSTTPRARPT